ncbi:hypothetical protein BDW68DRAFT_155176 [Aspergillus falconensis]
MGGDEWIRHYVMRVWARCTWRLLHFLTSKAALPSNAGATAAQLFLIALFLPSRNAQVLPAKPRYPLFVHRIYSIHSAFLYL